MGTTPTMQQLKKYALVLLVLLALNLLTARAGFYAEGDGVTMLTKHNFRDTVSRSKALWMVEFFAPWCGHCKLLAPEYKKAAAVLKDKLPAIPVAMTGGAKALTKLPVRLGAVDCTDEEAKMLCSLYELEGFPTIKVFDKEAKRGPPKHWPGQYDGARSAAAIVEFATAISNGAAVKGGDRDGPKDGCYDDKAWKDKDGESCKTYKDGGMCGDDAVRYTNDGGVSANTACCVCVRKAKEIKAQMAQHNTEKKARQDRQRELQRRAAGLPPPPAPIVVQGCDDDAKFRDKDGDSCKAYEDGAMCGKTAALYRNGAGQSANERCCACKAKAAAAASADPSSSACAELWEAAKFDVTKLKGLLAAKGGVAPEVNCAPPQNTSSPLHVAAEAGQLGAVRMLLAAGADVNRVAPKPEDGAGALQWAAWRGHTAVVELLLAHKADACHIDLYGCTPLHYTVIVATRKGPSFLASAARLIAACPAALKVRAKDPAGWNPLHAAAREGSSQMCQLMLGAGADVQARTDKKATCLHQAAVEGHAQLCKELLDAGGLELLGAKASRDETAKSLAQSYKKAGVVDAIDGWLKETDGGTKPRAASAAAKEATEAPAAAAGAGTGAGGYYYKDMSGAAKGPYPLAKLLAALQNGAFSGKLPVSADQVNYVALETLKDAEPAKDLWFYRDPMGESSGPYSAEAIKKAIDGGSLGAKIPVRRNSGEEWAPASEKLEL